MTAAKHPEGRARSAAEGAHPSLEDRVEAPRDARAVIVQVGAASAWGLSARQTAMAIRAGYGPSASVEVPILDAPPGESAANEGETREIEISTGKVRGAFLAGMASVATEERSLELAVLAFSEAHGGAYVEPAVVLAIIPQRKEADTEVSTLVRRMAERASVPIDEARSKCVEGGRVDLADLLETAVSLLRGSAPPPRVFIVAVDTQRDPLVLADWAEKRLVSLEGREPSGTEVTPGEAAACLVVELPGAEHVTRPLGFLLGWDKLVESRTFVEMTDVGPSPVLSEHLKAKLVGHEGNTTVWCDGDGHAEKSAEWTRIVGDLSGIELTLRSMGTELAFLGAASGAFYVAALCASFATKAIPETRAIVVVGRETDRATFTLAGAKPRTHVPQASPPRRASPAEESVSASRRVVTAERKKARRALGRLPGPVGESFRVAMDDAVVQAKRVEQGDLGDPNYVLLYDTMLAAFDELVRRAQAAATVERRRFPRDQRLRETPTILKKLEEELKGLRLAVIDRHAAMGGVQRPRARPVEAPFSASTGTPSSFGVSVPTRFDEPEASDEDDSEPEDIDESTSGDDDDRATIPPRPMESPDLEEMALECLDSIGRMRSLRRAERDVPWTLGLRDFEERMLAHLDLAFAVVNPGVSAEADAVARRNVDLVGKVVAMRVSDDEGLAFARALFLGSIEGDDGVEAVVATMRGAEERIALAQAEGLALASNVKIGPLVADALVDDDPVFAESGAFVLERKQHAPVGSLAAYVFHANPRVRRAAARSLGVSRHHRGAVTCIEAAIGVERDFSVQVEMIEALLRLRAPFAQDRLDALISSLAKGETEVEAPLRTRALGLFAAQGRTSDLGTYLTLVKSPADIDCLGFCGRASAVGWLVEALRRAKSREEIEASARALQRITGAGPHATRKDKLAALELTSVDEEQLVKDPARWQVYWDEAGVGFSLSKKYRFGKTFELNQAARELVTGGVFDRERRLLRLEIELHSVDGRLLRDTQDWVDAQLQVLGVIVS